MGENNMQKPLSVARYEFIQQLTNLINGSNLPMCMVEAVLKDMYADVKVVAQRQLENDLRAYQEAMERLDDDSRREAEDSE